MKVNPLELGKKHTTTELVVALTDLILAHNALVDLVNEKITAPPVRDRGPKSERPMTQLDAWRARFGDLKGQGHKVTAGVLGLSYGQVYSCRNGYTFQNMKPDSFSLSDIAPAPADTIEAAEVEEIVASENTGS